MNFKEKIKYRALNIDCNTPYGEQREKGSNETTVCNVKKTFIRDLQDL